MFSKFFFSEVQAAPETLVNTRKFDTALRFANVRLVTEDLKKGQLHLSTRCLLLHKSEADLITARKDHKLWPVMLSNILSDSRTERNYRPFAKDPCNRVFRLIRENFELQHTYIASALIHPTNEALHSNFGKWLTRTMRSSTLIRNLVTFEHELGILVEKQGGLQHRLRDRKVRENMMTLKGLTKWRSKDIPLECCWSKEVVHVTYNKEVWLVPSVYLIQIHNKVCDILSSLLLIQASSGVCYETNALNTSVELIEELCLLSLTHDNYFDIAKTLEGMVTAETLVTEDDWVNTTLRDSIHKELAECGFLYKGSNLQEILKEASTPLRHELAGLLKVCGHPIIDVEMTAEKAKERATVSVEVNYHAIQMTRNIALQTFVRNYIVKHGKWPPVEIEDGCPPGLLEARRLNRDPHSAYIKRLFGEVKAEDYVYVTLGQVMDLDKLDHYSQYLKDRALSVLKDEAVAFYIDKTMEQLDWKKTRLLLVYLLHTEEELDLGGYLENYMKSGMSMEDVLNYLTIKLVPKEKELKVAARPFGCKTYQDRYRSCLQEENVKHFLDKYSEDQSMTLDNLALIQRMYCFRNLTKIYKGWRVLYINFDVSGWCGNFRHETVEPICHDLLDAVFGTKDFFSKTQRAYEKGFFYLPDIGGVYHWEGQEGGIEGLNQYTWMTTYIPLMQYALRDFGLHFFVMAYGDDYKAALLIPPDQSAVKLEDLKHVVVQTVSDTARLDFGQKMKYFDSYGSEVFISFCKNASVRACEMPQGVRKIQKCYGATNAFLPTLDDYLSSAFSNAHSAARTMPCTYPAYFVALFWGYHHLITHVQWEDALDDEIHCAMMVPSCAGGLPILFLINFHTRAENDHLPTFIDLVKHIGKIKPELGRRLTHAVSFTRLEAGRYEALLRDPYSLPIVKPPLPSGVLRRELIPALRPIIKNAEVRVLLEAAEDDWTDRIIRCMMSSSEIPARVYSSIFSCTPKALIEEIVKRFETSASIKEILVRRRGPRVTIRILRRVLNAEIALQKWRYERFHLPETEVGLWWNEIPCPTQQADSLRALWGKQVTGVTMPPLTHLLTIVDPSMAAHDEYSRKHHFTYQTFTPEKVVKRSDGAHWHLGEEKPFLGHKTKLGSEVPQVKILDTNPFLSKIKTLLDIVSWVSIGKVNPDGELVESNLPDLIRVLITQYYKGDPKELIPFASQRKSGTIQHHWRSPHYSEHIMPNTLYNTYTWIRGDSNTHQILRGTTDHYTLNFLQVYCHVLHCIQLNLEVSSEILGPGVYWAITTACTYCMRPIDEEPVRVDQSMIPAPRPQVLEGLEITSLSRSLLHEAAQMVLKKAPRNIVEGEVRVDFAVCGVVQTLADQSYTKAKRVCDRLDAPMRVSEDVDMMADWVPGGWQALVREREIRHCPIGLLSEAVLLTIFHMSFQLGSKAMMRSQLIRVWHRNPRELPWTPMIEAIRKAGRLCDVLITVANISGRHPPMCYDNALSASRHLGEIALTQGLLGYLPLKFAWLTYYEEEMVSESMKIFARHAQYVAIWAKIRPLLLTAMRSKVRDAEAEKIMVVAMYLIAAADVADAETIENLIGNSKDGVAVVQVILTDLTDDAVYDNEVERPGSMVNELASSLNDIGAPPGKGQHPPDYEYLLDSDEEANAFIAAEALGHITLSVTQTSLADCINRVRALPDERPIEYTHGSGTAVQGGEIAVADRRPEIKIGFYTAGEDLPTTDITKAHAIVDIFPTKEVILSGHALARPYGHATLSLNKILEIFSHLKLDTTTLSGKNVMCLAEGYGGIMDCLARLSRGSHFVYNTLPPSLQAYVTPAIAVETLRARGHSWDEELVNTSVFDLTLKSTVKALEKNDDRLYHLITCDAEADWSNREKYHALLLNVTHLYLRKRSPKGILILKVMLEHNRSICAVLSLLAHYSERVGCFRLTSSPPGGECYIVARGARRQYAEPITPPDMVLSPKITRLVSTMTKALQRHWEALIPPLDYSLTIQLPAHIDYLRKMKDLLPPAAIHRLISRHQLPITLRDEDYASKRSLTKGVLRELKVVRTALDKEYLAHEGSAAGVVHLALRRILVESCRLHLDAVLVRNIHVYSHSDLRSAFLAFIETMTDRIVFPDPPEIFHETIEIYGVTCDPFPSWLEGIETAMCLWTYNRL